MKFKAPKLRINFFILILSIVDLSCNEDFNTVGYDLISTNAFETDRVKLPVFSYQKESLTNIQTNGLSVQQLGTIEVPNVGRSSAYIISQLNMPATNGIIGSPAFAITSYGSLESERASTFSTTLFFSD